jgi:hypothetical protein
VEDGSGEGKEMGTADGASIAGATGNPVVLTIHATLNTEGNPTRKPLLHEVFQTRIIVRELGLKLFGGVFLLGRTSLSTVHGLSLHCEMRFR